MSAPIFYLSPGMLDDVEPGNFVELLGDEGHHARTVKRLNVGEKIDVADGSGLRILGEVAELLPEGLRVRVLEVLPQTSGPEVILVQALAKNDRDILGIETATELGVIGVIPWAADRSIVRWKKERLEKHHTKWENTVRAAAKQSRSPRIPEVYDLHTSAELAAVFSEDTSSGAHVFMLHESGLNKFSSQIRSVEIETETTIYVIVGPEGGISEREISLFEDAGGKTALLGNEVLRSSTAGAAAIVVLKTLLGQW